MRTNFQLKEIAALDFRNNKKQLIVSYILRIVGFATFGLLLALLSHFIYPHVSLQIDDLISIKIPGIANWMSIILLIAVVVLVLSLHELIHATVAFISNGQKPKIGMRGLVIFAAAPDSQLSKKALIINALAPFIIISLIGIILIGIIPASFVAWIYIPTVVNAGSAGGDFQMVAWSLKHPKGTIYIDQGDITKAYIRDQEG